MADGPKPLLRAPHLTSALGLCRGASLCPQKPEKCLLGSQSFSCHTEMGLKLLFRGRDVSGEALHIPVIPPNYFNFPPPPIFCNSALLCPMMKGILTPKEKTDHGNQSLFLELLGIGEAGV